MRCHGPSKGLSTSPIYILLGFFLALPLVSPQVQALPNPEIARTILRPHRAIIVAKVPRRVYRAPRSRIVLQSSLGASNFEVLRDRPLRRLRARNRRARRVMTVRLRHPVSQDGLYRYRSQLKRRGRISDWSPIVSVLAVSEPGPTPDLPQYQVESFPCTEGFKESILQKTNSFRSQEGLTPLASDQLLSHSAALHTLRMISNQVLSHDGWFEPILALGISGSSFGQNIASHYSTPNSVMNAWMLSPGHRSQILSVRYRFLGVSCLKDSNGRHWWTQNFSN